MHRGFTSLYCSRLWRRLRTQYLLLVQSADEIIRERQKNGPFKSYMEFLDRVDLRSVNRKAMEVLIKTGCFDKIEPNRNRLLINFEDAIEYAESKKNQLATDK